MALVAEATEIMESYPPELTRQVFLLDDASLSLGVGQVKAGRALQQAWNQYRHLKWVVILTARTFKSISTVAEGADVKVLKRPEPDIEAFERRDSESMHWWGRAAEAFDHLHATTDWRDRPNEKQWIFAYAPKLNYEGLFSYSGPTHEGMVPLQLTEGA